MSSGFVSEADLAERRRLRNENWQKNRGEDDPEEPPEDPELLPDRRTLYEKLQEQKDKKQEEWEEAHRLKNMVRGLEDEEVGFLELVDETKLREENRIKNEEKSALQEYRQKVAERQIKSIRAAINADAESGRKQEEKTTKNRPSQMSLLAGAIKRKCSDSEDDRGNPEKYPKNDEDVNGESRKCIGILPGIGEYTDSSDSDADSCYTGARQSQLSKDLAGRVIRKASSS